MKTARFTPIPQIYKLLPAFCIVLLMLFSVPTPATAAPQALNLDDKSHAKRALSYADEGKWGSALKMARKAHHPAVKTLVLWRKMKSPSSNASFEEITAFMQTHPDWPHQETLAMRAERALTKNHPADTIISWLTAHPPVTTQGKLLLAETLLAKEQNGDSAQPPSPDVIARLRDIWRSGGLDSEEQAVMLKKYGAWFSPEDHAARIDALLWEQRVTQSQPLWKKTSKDYQALFNARAMLIRDRPGLTRAINAVPEHLREDPGLIYERLHWRNKRKLDSGVLELLEIAPAEVPHAKKWWPARHRQIRELLDKKRYRQAFALAQNHGQKDGIERIEAEWLAGWIALTFMGKPDIAYTHFFRLHHTANFPVSKARGAYWAALSAEKNGNRNVANDWFEVAAGYPSSFYGQLALLRHKPGEPYQLPEEPAFTHSDYRAFLKRPVVQAALILHELDERSDALRFMLSFTTRTSSDAERAMLAKLAHEIKRSDFAVKIAKTARQEGTELPKSGYPVMRIRPRPIVEPALVMAIARQESEFRMDSQSGAGAVGLMQVLPSTARHVARHLNERYSSHKLRNSAEFNLRIGAAYLEKLMHRYDGSLLLTIAAYNAGPGRVDRWLKQYGDPRSRDTEPLLWAEQIPFKETRNYVQRVLENLQIYRYLLHGKDEKLPLQLAQDLHLFDRPASAISTATSR